MSKEIEKGRDKIYCSSLIINSCIQSLEYILKDLDEMEMCAQNDDIQDYRGLANIVAQLTNRIRIENIIIMNLSDPANFDKLYNANK